MLISIVIPTLNESDNLRKTIESLQDTLTQNYEIIVVDNGSTDGSSDFLEREVKNSQIRLFKTERLGVANARNFGAQQAQGKFLFFVDAHVLFRKDWIEPLLYLLKKEKVGIVASTISNWGNSRSKGYGFKWRNPRLDMLWLAKQNHEPYPVPMVAGMFQGFRATTFFEMGCFDSGMVNFGSEDAEICLRAWTLGYKVCVVPEVEILHLFRRRHPYKVHWYEVVYNMLRTVISHFSEERMDRSIRAIQTLPSFNSAYNEVQKSDIWQRRQHFFENRIRNDDWFFKEFNMNI